MVVVLSCSKRESDESIAVVERSESKVTAVDGMLKFADYRQLDSTLNLLLMKDETQLNAWYDSVGFVSQEALWNEALAEFDQLTSADQLPGYKAKYSSVFLFDDEADDDWQPYLPANKPAYSFILNRSGDVIVGDMVLNFNYTDFKQTVYYRSREAYYASKMGTKATTTVPNMLYVELQDRKFWAESFRSWYCVWIRFTAQKRGFMSWNHYRESYNTQLIEVIQDTPEGWTHINTEEVSSINNRGPVWVGPLNAGHEVSIGTVCKVPNYQGSGIDFYPDVDRKYYIYTADVGSSNGGVLHLNLPAVTN